MKGVVDLPQLLQAARALGADAVADPDLEPDDPRLQLQAAALVYGAAEAAGLDDLDTAVAWMTWNANRVAELAAQHVDEQPSPELAAAVALATALQALLSALTHRRRGDREKFEDFLSEALLRMRDAASNLNQPQ